VSVQLTCGPPQLSQHYLASICDMGNQQRTAEMDTGGDRTYVEVSHSYCGNVDYVYLQLPT